jgi:Uma2 family endonuclease
MAYDVEVTVAEFETLPDDGNLHELDAGELVAMPPRGFTHGRVQAAVLEALSRAADRGIALGRCGFRLAPDVVQAPDVAFIREERESEIVWDRYCEFGPDLAVEILSPDDNAARLQRKIARYLAAGTSIVWVLGPDSVTANVYQKPGVFRTLTADEMIDAPELLPGFSIPVRAFFE